MSKVALLRLSLPSASSEKGSRRGQRKKKEGEGPLAIINNKKNLSRERLLWFTFPTSNFSSQIGESRQEEGVLRVDGPPESVRFVFCSSET
jgi:hypothetical protein